MAVPGKILKGDKISAFAEFQNSGLLLFNWSKSITCFRVMSDNSRLLSGDEGGRIYTWCLKSYTCLNEFKADKTMVIAIHEVQSANHFITVFKGLEIKVWGNYDYVLKFTIKINLPIVFSKVCEDELVFAILKKNGNYSIFNAVNMSNILDNTSEVLYSNVFDVCEPENILVIGCENKLSFFCTLYNCQQRSRISHDSAVTAVSIMKKPKKIFIGEVNGLLTIFNLLSLEKIAEIQTCSLNLISLSGIQDQKQVIFASGNKSISLIKTTGNKLPKLLNRFQFQLKSIQVFDNNQKIVCSMANGSIQVFDFRNGNKIGEFFPLFSWIRSVYYNEFDKKVLLSTDLVGNFNEWKVAEKKVKNLLSFRNLKVTSIRYSKKSLAVSHQNLKVFVFLNNN